MADIDKETLKQEAFTFITNQQLGVISTVDKDGIPESAAVNYLLENTWILYVITDKDSRKVQNLRQNPHVAFVSGTTPFPNTAQMQGTAEIIESSNEAFEALVQKMVDSKRLNNDPMYNMFGHNYVVLRITITWLRWLAFDQTNGSPVYSVLMP